MSARRVERVIEALVRELRAAEAEVERWPKDGVDSAVAPVSAWSPAQHLHHVSLANEAIIETVERIVRGDADVLEPGCRTIWGRLILWTGRMPRGRGRSPRHLLPADHLPRDRVLAQLARTREDFAALASESAKISAARGQVRHFACGCLNAREWLLLALIHTRHHLRIIEAIRKVQTA